MCGVRRVLCAAEGYRSPKLGLENWPHRWTVVKKQRAGGGKQVLEMGMRKQLEQYTAQIKADKQRRELLETQLSRIQDM